jgi:hypothetical protein
MARRKQSYLKGRFEPRRTEGDYMAVLLDAVTLEEWRSVVVATVAAAKAGDPSARAWLAQYLVGIGRDRAGPADRGGAAVIRP